MSEIEFIPDSKPIRDWVNEAKADPVAYRRRQVTEILLAAIGLTTHLKDSLILKGGTLMAIGFKSARVTGDVDFTSVAEPGDLDERIEQELNEALQVARAKLGYLDILCKVQKVKKKPFSENFKELSYPALDMTIGYANKGSKGEAKLKNKLSTEIVKVEISFKEQVYAFKELCLTGAEVAIRAYSETEVVAEKLRALLQQPILRGKTRRQDIYDIAYLIDQRGFNNAEKKVILETLLNKCQTRGITPTRTSIEDPKIKELAHKQWHTLQDELDEVPDFETNFRTVSQFYSSLPWEELPS